MIKDNKLYDRLKFLAQVLLPALGTLYFALAGIWGFPAAEKVVGTIVAVDTFLGVLLHISTTAYNASDARYDGNLVITEPAPGKRNFSLELYDDPEYHLEGKDQILFKVQKNA
jgi:hypothetical protein